MTDEVKDKEFDWEKDLDNVDIEFNISDTLDVMVKLTYKENEEKMKKDEKKEIEKQEKAKKEIDVE